VLGSDSYFDLNIDYLSRKIVISGEFDAATAQCLARAIAALQRSAGGDITIRLDDVTFIDAAGVGAVDLANSAQSGRGAHLTVVGANADIREVFTVGRLLSLLQAS
jgi:anti-anti-sigma factor